MGGAFERQPMHRWGFGFQEASAFQYRYFLPWNARGLSALYGGRLCEQMESDLNRSFAGDATSYYSSQIHEVLEAEAIGDKRFGQLAHSNQPSHYWLHLMRAGSRAETPACVARARGWIRRVLLELYSPAGYCGDEDNGEMAAWYLLSAAGVYPLSLASDDLVLGAPLFNRIELQLGGGRRLTVRRRRRSASPDEAGIDALWEPRDHAAEGEAAAPARSALTLGARLWRRWRASRRKPVPCVRVVRFSQLREGGTLTFLEDEDFDPLPSTRAQLQKLASTHARLRARQEEGARGSEAEAGFDSVPGSDGEAMQPTDEDIGG
jgi:hypothetical protein